VSAHGFGMMGREIRVLEPTLQFGWFLGSICSPGFISFDQIWIRWLSVLMPLLPS
jgi:hypothetical protein